MNGKKKRNVDEEKVNLFPVGESKLFNTIGKNCNVFCFGIVMIKLFWDDLSSRGAVFRNA